MIVIRGFQSSSFLSWSLIFSLSFFSGCSDKKQKLNRKPAIQLITYNQKMENDELVTTEKSPPVKRSRAEDKVAGFRFSVEKLKIEEPEAPKRKLENQELELFKEVSSIRLQITPGKLLHFQLT